MIRGGKKNTSLCCSRLLIYSSPFLGSAAAEEGRRVKPTPPALSKALGLPSSPSSRNACWFLPHILKPTRSPGGGMEEQLPGDRTPASWKSLVLLPLLPQQSSPWKRNRSVKTPSSSQAHWHTWFNWFSTHRIKNVEFIFFEVLIYIFSCVFFWYT